MHLGFTQLCQVQNWQLVGEPKGRKHVKDAFKFIHLFIRPSIFKELSLFCNWTAYSKNLFDSSCWLKPLKKNLKIGQVFLDNGIDGQLSREGFCASDFQVACFFYGRGGDGENRGGPGHTDRATRRRGQCANLAPILPILILRQKMQPLSCLLKYKILAFFKAFST